LILLLGGTSETKGIALALAQTGAKVLASTATDNELDVGTHENIVRRRGRLTEEEMISLIKENGATMVVDSTHPFAVVAHETARSAAKKAGVRYIRFERPGSEYGSDAVVRAEDHESAARLAFSFGRPVLLTTGSRNLLPYVEESRRTGLLVIARVLPHAESLVACKNAGIPESSVITGRGPFTVEENLAVIKKFDIGVLVTKDSGQPGGVPEKIIAAERSSCRVVMVKRPDASASSVESIERLLEEIVKAVEI
jgi:precorrin-6A/cobalt-precorrin-6A reductase